MNTLQAILEKDMDRREFLLYTGLILITITGIAGMTKSVQNIFNQRTDKGFGSNPYGK